MTRTALLCFLLAACAPAASRPAPITATPRDAQLTAKPRDSQLNGKHNLLRIQARGPASGWDTLDAETLDELTRFAVGADVRVWVPSFLGTGHGPFQDVHQGQRAARAADGLTVAPHKEDSLIVRCTRAGVFELAVDVIGLDGKTITDAIDIGCITPTRFEAKIVADQAGTRYLAGVSQVDVSLAWYGQRGSDEVQLVGTLPATSSDAQTLAIVSQGTHLGLRALRAAASPQIESVGMRAALPIEIVEPTDLSLAIEVKRAQLISVTVKATDALGGFAGLRNCDVVFYRGDTELARAPTCWELVNHKEREWAADRVCATARGKRTCSAM